MYKKNLWNWSILWLTRMITSIQAKLWKGTSNEHKHIESIRTEYVEHKYNLGLIKIVRLLQNCLNTGYRLRIGLQFRALW